MHFGVKRGSGVNGVIAISAADCHVCHPDRRGVDKIWEGQPDYNNSFYKG